MTVQARRKNHDGFWRQLRLKLSRHHVWTGRSERNGDGLAAVLNCCPTPHVLGRERRTIVVADIEDDIRALADKLDRMSLRFYEGAALATLRLCRGKVRHGGDHSHHGQE